MERATKIECPICDEETLVEAISGETPYHCPMCGHPVNIEEDGYDEEDDY
jgi:endogenous inhibitor of DNA gyrase (YacG/DUF329 family)